MNSGVVSGAPSSEPCTAEDACRFLWSSTTIGENVTEYAPPCPCCPTRCRQMSFSSEDSEVQAVPLHRRTNDRGEPPSHAPVSLASRSMERCGHSRRAKCSNAVDLSAFQCRLAIASLTLEVCEADRKLS